MATLVKEVMLNVHADNIDDNVLSSRWRLPLLLQVIGIISIKFNLKGHYLSDLVYTASSVSLFTGIYVYGRHSC